jgi:hypothetical protein
VEKPSFSGRKRTGLRSFPSISAYSTDAGFCLFHACFLIGFERHRGWFFGFGSRVSVIWLLSWPVLRQRNVFWLLVLSCGSFGFLNWWFFV